MGTRYSTVASDVGHGVRRPHSVAPLPFVSSIARRIQLLHLTLKFDQIVPPIFQRLPHIRPKACLGVDPAQPKLDRSGHRFVYPC